MKTSEIEKAKNEAGQMLSEAGIILAKDESVEITDFGKNDYKNLGLGLIVRLNEAEYASKWLTILPGQTCPNHYHKIIKETFFILKGDVTMILNNNELLMRPGDKVTLPPRTWHAFTSETGAIIEEITTHQIKDDSYFEDPSIRRYVSVEPG